MSLPGAWPPLAYLAVPPGCLAGPPGAWNCFVPPALAHAKKLGGKIKLSSETGRWLLTEEHIARDIHSVVQPMPDNSEVSPRNSNQEPDFQSHLRASCLISAETAPSASRGGQTGPWRLSLSGARRSLRGGRRRTGAGRHRPCEEAMSLSFHLTVCSKFQCYYFQDFNENFRIFIFIFRI